ncbi:Sodium/hydrogen exchanger family-domain-containing protein [Lactarius vividus]|nr:Sodium/hydrogen exchanger family-domain-containing protein [Lactarius vividus]
MHFHPFEVSTPHIIYACLGGFVVFFGMFSLFIREKLYIGEACWAFLFGVIIGPYGANIIDPRSWGDEDATNHLTLEFTRIVIAIGVFAVGVELPKKYMYRHWRSLFFLLVPVMAWGWFVSAAFIYALVPNLNFLSALAVGACLTPTDPILAAAIIGGKYADKHVPAHLRHLIAAEAGSNDGAAYPFLYFALYLTLDGTTGGAMKDWILVSWLYQIILSVIWGSMLGYGFRHLMKFCEKKDLIDRQSYVAQYVSLALLTVGTTSLLGSDDLLASFVCGTVFAWDGFFNKQTEASVFSSVIDLLLNTAAFVFVGVWMPFNTFSDHELSLSVGRLISIAVLVLLLRRLPIIIGLYKWIPDIKSFREALFSGHFGPIGIGAIFMSTLAAETLPRPQSPPANQAELLAATIQPVIAFMVLCSILIHGLSIPFFSLGRRVTTVTRTWSRQPSLPDWALHTHRVERAEDVVINRDPENMMERGQASNNEKDVMKRHPSEATGFDEDEKGARALKREDTAEADALTVAVTESEEAKPDNPPDGTESYEWKEGPHRITDWRTGPGEEVEVEVQRNDHGSSEAGHITPVSRNGRAAVHHSAPAAPERATRHVPHEEAEPEDTIGNRDASPPPQIEVAVDALQPNEVLSNSSQQPEVVHEDEDGWVSDRSSPEDAQAKVEPRAEKRPFTGRTSKKRRADDHRPSIQHNPRVSLPAPIDTSPSADSNAATATVPSAPSMTAGPESPLPKSPSSPSDIADDEPRGRTLPASASSTFSARRKPRHMRIVSLRGSEASSREVSPARSIRWADAGAGSTPATARWPQAPSAQGSRAPSPSPADSAENDTG